MKQEKPKVIPTNSQTPPYPLGAHKVQDYICFTLEAPLTLLVN
jgi:hypothetical protein